VAIVISRFLGPWYFLSNFRLAVLTWEGIEYPTSEHAYNAGKTHDRDLREKIANVVDPRQAKKLGRSAVLRPGWEATVRYDVMREVLRAKFACDPRRTAALLSTGDAYLVEGNIWHDQHWGNCLCGREKCAERGANHLGRHLMQLRAELS
jgi:ribA/ribD-fused uncharacterized protein